VHRDIGAAAHHRHGDERHAPGNGPSRSPGAFPASRQRASGIGDHFSRRRSLAPLLHASARSTAMACLRRLASFQPPLRGVSLPAGPLPSSAKARREAWPSLATAARSEPAATRARANDVTTRRLRASPASRCPGGQSQEASDPSGRT
jgi:hypothetical protein